MFRRGVGDHDANVFITLRGGMATRGASPPPAGLSGCEAPPNHASLAKALLQGRVSLLRPRRPLHSYQVRAAVEEEARETEVTSGAPITVHATPTTQVTTTVHWMPFKRWCKWAGEDSAARKMPEAPERRRP